MLVAAVAVVDLYFFFVFTSFRVHRRHALEMYDCLFGQKGVPQTSARDLQFVSDYTSTFLLSAKNLLVCFFFFSFRSRARSRECMCVCIRFLRCAMLGVKMRQKTALQHH